jgi:hypothetical protein
MSRLVNIARMNDLDIESFRQGLLMISDEDPVPQHDIDQGCKRSSAHQLVWGQRSSSRGRIW